MKKGSFFLTLLTLAVVGCTLNPPAIREDKYLFYEVNEGVDVEELYGSPWLNSSVQGMIQKIKKPSEKDDFYASTNYETIPTFTIPEGSMRGGGLLGNATTETSQMLYALVSEETNTPLSKYLKNATEYFVNGSKQQIKNKIIEINSYTTKQEFYDYFSTVDSVSTTSSVLTPYNYYGYQTLIPGGMLDQANPQLLPLIYENRNKTSALNRINNAIKKLYVELGYTEDEADGFVNGYASKEAAIIKHISYYAFSDVKTINVIDESFTDFRIKSVLNQLGYLDSDTVYMLTGTINYVNAFTNLSLEDMKNIVMNRLVFDYAPTFGLEAYNTFLNYLSTLGYSTYNGMSDVRVVTNIFDKLFTQFFEVAYYQAYCNSDVKDAVMDLIQDIVDEYKVILQNNDWLSDTTKTKAISKVSKMKFEASYSDELKDVPEFNPTSCTSSFDFYREINLWTKRADQLYTGWYWPCYTVNGAYSPTTNSFIIYDGILNGGVFELNKTKEELYATLGMIIGHEISHAFDSNGSYFDEDGNQKNWWTAGDTQKFNTKINKMVSYINLIEVKKGVRMKGSKVNGEVTADMGGIKVMLSLAAKETNFDYDKFFRSFSAMWANVYTEGAVTYYNINDEHPLSYIRVNLTLAQFEKFYETYGIKQGDGMYIEPDNRIAIW